MQSHSFRSLVFLFVFSLVSTVQAEPGAPTLWYCEPAESFGEALPLGNGRLGVMVFGGVAEEVLLLDESTCWSGARDAETIKSEGKGNLVKARELLFEQRFAEAKPLIDTLLGKKGNYGTHLPMAKLRLAIAPAHAGSATEYVRRLDLENATASVRYKIGETVFQREAFVSHPHQVAVVRVWADRPGQVSLKAELQPRTFPLKIAVDDEDSLLLSGSARETKHSNGKVGVNVHGRIMVKARGGKQTTHEQTVLVESADSAILYIALGTDYRGGNPSARCRQQIERAVAMDYEELLAVHQKDHRALFGRVALDLGPSPRADQPIDRRLEAVRGGQSDPSLDALFFQFGRYLLIGSSREDSPLPANLQGIWNDGLACSMGWTCDFHLDINTQMNYWIAEVGNLPECNGALFRWIESLLVPSGRVTAQDLYGCKGWVAHVFSNAWGFTGMGWDPGWGTHVTGGTWIATHLWERYRYGGDKQFLKEVAYPILKEHARFFEDYLVEHPRYGCLVTGPATSPENWFRHDGVTIGESMGPTCDRVLVHELLSACIEASEILDVDAAKRQQWIAMRTKLPPLKIGKHGQLQEWLEDYDEAIPNHRHTTHLIALYPAAQITPRHTPELAKAARVTIDRRVSLPDWEDVEWSRANLINFYARLRDAEAAHSSLELLMTKLGFPNLMTFSASGIAGARNNIWVMDGNTAGSAGIAEMLMQCHVGTFKQGYEIELLPALPAAWPTGSVNGLCARGGFLVDIQWADGRLTGATVRSALGNDGRIRFGKTVIALKTEAEGVYCLNGELKVQ